MKDERRDGARLAPERKRLPRNEVSTTCVSGWGKEGPNQGKLALEPFAYAHGTDSSSTREGERRMPATQTYLTVPQALDFVRLSVVIFGRIRK